MKAIKILLGVIGVALASVYILVFTSIGNSIVKPIIESKIKEATQLDIKLEKFSLGFSDLDIIVAVTPENKVHLKGGYSIFSQSLDLAYNVNFENLSQLQKIANQPLNGVFHTNGTIKGDMALLNIDGKSDLAKSDTSYHVTLTQQTPTNITAKIAQLDIATLLQMVGQKPYAKAILNSDITLTDIRPHHLAGTIALTTTQGTFDQKLLKEDLNITAPQTSFDMNLQAKLDKDTIDYDYIFNSNLAKLTTKGSVIPQPLSFDINYAAAVKELALLKPLTNANLRGKVALHGTLKGDAKDAKLHLLSDVAASDTTVDVSLKNFQPSNVIATIKHLKLEKLFYMIYQPRYCSGDFNLQANLTSLDPKNLQGVVKTSTSALLNSKYLTKAYQFKHPLPKTSLKATTTSNLDKTLVTTALNVHSNLANLNVKKAVFNIENGSLKSDYYVSIPSLNRLYFITDRHLRGGLKANGTIKQHNTSLLFTAHSNIANGKLDLKLVDNKLNLNLNNMRTKKLLWILTYPEIFDGGINAKVNYNLLLQKGTASAKFDKGVFLHNKPFDLLRQFAHVDLYKERFDGDASAKINKEKIFTTFDLISRHASIKSKKTYINTKRSTIDSAITIVAKKTPVTVTLKGNIAQPKVGVDLQKLIQTQAGQKLEKKASQQVQKLFQKLF